MFLCLQLSNVADCRTLRMMLKWFFKHTFWFFSIWSYQRMLGLTLDSSLPCQEQRYHIRGDQCWHATWWARSLRCYPSQSEKSISLVHTALIVVYITWVFNSSRAQSPSFPDVLVHGCIFSLFCWLYNVYLAHSLIFIPKCVLFAALVIHYFLGFWEIRMHYSLQNPILFCLHLCTMFFYLNFALWMGIDHSLPDDLSSAIIINS